MGNASRCAIKLSRHQLLRDPENFLTFFLSSSPFRQPFPATFRLPQLHSGKILVMSDAEGESQKPFCVEYANSGRAGCKKCKQKIDKGAMRIGKLAPNPFSEGLMKQWFHPQCIFEAFLKQRATTARIRDLNEDVDGVDALKSEDRDSLNELIDRKSRFFL
ncbi:unnamed protein product [Notodromas monacha]|uniref:PARP-type domain-containing protein n=1 Tax=Notodromas monacha TaxID=399045 RepID=A0A7R9BQY9_9CRUS|nr:unnamed protein product [Notodromas monacha]CAG0920072.1 unnamed protein product [Notodromas monacha]